MLVTGSLKNAMDGGVIKIYGGVSGAALTALTADDALPVGAVLLAAISKNGAVVSPFTTWTATDGLSFDAAAVNGVVTKASETWLGNVIASGTATFFRHVLSGDAGDLSTTARRIQGTIGTVGEDLNLSSVALVLAVPANPQSINFYSVALPTL